MRMYLLLFVWTTILQRYRATGARITCGRRVIYAKHQYGTFTSPGFPFSYPNNMDCEWVIQAPEGHQVELIFLKILTESCCDTIELRDGNSSSAGLLVTYRGEVTESMYASSFGSLYLKFTSDDSYVDYGFIAEYRIATTRSINCTMELEATNDVQVISSPGYPYLYENNLLCTWTLVAPEDKSVEINFTEFSTERCCDFALVRYGRSMNSPIHNYGGHIDEPIVHVSPGNVIQVMFRSDSTVARKGFHLEYKAVDRMPEPIQESKKDQAKCGGKIEVPLVGHGVLTTPRFPDHHANDLNCVWVLVAPPGKRVMVWFTYIETEACCDFIKIRDGESPTSKKIGILSGRLIPLHYYNSTRNVLRIDFQSDLTTVNTGFRAVYEVLKDSKKEACGGELQAVPDKIKYLSSPNWPKSPPAGLCAWQIKAPKGYTVKIRIIGFHTSKGIDRIDFRDGSTRRLFAQTWGNRQVDDESFQTKSNILSVVYWPDVTTGEGGFRAHYTAVPTDDSTPHKLPLQRGNT